MNIRPKFGDLIVQTDRALMPKEQKPAQYVEAILKAANVQGADVVSHDVYHGHGGKGTPYETVGFVPVNTANNQPVLAALAAAKANEGEKSAVKKIFVG